MVRLLICLSAIHFGALIAMAQSTLSDLFPDPVMSEIERHLDRKQDMVFEDATLQDLVAFLENSGIPTIIDKRALEDFGIPVDVPIAFRQHAIEVRDGLRLILDSLELTWMPLNGRLVISTPEQAEACLLIKVYDVRNLVDVVPVLNQAGTNSDIYRYDFDSLIEAITNTIEPYSWDEVGGPASINPYYTRRMRVLVTAQTYQAHRKLEALLNELAEHGGAKPLPTPAKYGLSRRQIAGASRLPTRQTSRASGSVRSSQLKTTGQ